MWKRPVFKGLAVAALLISAAAPVCAALQGHINFSTRAIPDIDMSAVTGSIGSNDAECGPVYVPTLVHERDGSIVGTAYVLDGDDC